MNPQNNLQKMQEQMRRQQEQQRQRMMGAAWMEQQKKKAAAGQVHADDPYSQLEAYVQYLKGEYAAKRISKEQAEAQLRENIIEDGSGVKWTVGFESGQWYRFNGEKWVQAAMPRYSAQQVNALPEQIAAPKTHPIQGFFAFVFGCFLTFIAGIAMGWVATYILELRSPEDFYPIAAVWLIGFIMSVRWGRKVSSGG